MLPASATPAATASSSSSCSLPSGSAGPSTARAPHTSTRCLSNATSSQRPPSSRPPKLSLIIPTSQSASRRLACNANNVGNVDADSKGVNTRFHTSSQPSDPSPSSADSDSSHSESLPSHYSRSSHKSSSLPGPPAPESQTSYHDSSNIYHPPSTLYKQDTPPPPLPATVVAHTLLSRHISGSSRTGSPWGALGATCGRRRYVESGLKAEV